MARAIACMGRRITHVRFWWKNQKERDREEDIEVFETV
jgi:hypothetical protein